jgi:hypothetical protein
VRRLHYGAVEEAEGRGEPGRRRRGAGAGGRCGDGARPEVGDGPDRWAPPVGGCEGEEECWAAGQSWAAR